MTDFIKPTLTFDIEEFQHHLDGSDLTETEKEELLKTLWEIICEFVLFGFGVHPVQQIKSTDNAENPDQADGNTVKCAHKTLIGKRAAPVEKSKV